MEVDSNFILIHKGKQIDRQVSEGIREIDTKEAELDYIISQYE